MIWVFLALGSALLFSFRDILTKQVFIHHEASSNELVTTKYFLLLLAGLFVGGFVDVSALPKLWFWFVLKATLVVVVLLVYYQLLSRYEVSKVAPMLNISPAVLLVFSYIFLGEHAGPLAICGVLVLILGTLILQYPINLSATDIYFWLFSAIMIFAITVLGMTEKVILNNTDMWTNLVITGLPIVFTLFMYNMFRTDAETFLHHITRPHAIWSSFIDALSDILIIAAIAIPGAFVSLIVPLRRTSTLFTALFGGVFFKESRIGIKLLAIAIMLTGIILIVI